MNIPLLKRVLDFFKPDNLAQQELKVREHNMALLVIDVQKRYCDPRGDRGNKHTKEVSKKLASIIPEFRKAGIPIYAIYFEHSHKIDFYKYKPHSSDIIVLKQTDSAFKSSNLHDLLKKGKHKYLLACGFNASACVERTCLDGRKLGYNIGLLADLLENDNRCTNKSQRITREEALQDFDKLGFPHTTAADALKTLKAMQTGTQP